jgi:hypothetical protein
MTVGQIVKQEVLGRTNFAYFPYISHLFEVLGPNLMELNLSELILTSFNSTLCNGIYCGKQLGCHGYHGT